MANHKVQHDRPNCIGCGACTGICPKFWEMGNDGKVNLKGSKKIAKGWTELEIKEEDVDCNKEAASHCPVKVIHVS